MLSIIFDGYPPDNDVFIFLILANFSKFHASSASEEQYNLLYWAPKEYLHNYYIDSIIKEAARINWYNYNFQWQYVGV